MKVLVLALALVSGLSAAEAKTKHACKSGPVRVKRVRRVVVPVYPKCSTAGDETVRPVFGRTANGGWTVVGYECKQDNRGGGGGGARF